ncbi:hypothetical protein RFI_02469 [Reticulomyxa filosa]|uniref:Uncharacterized protein n=1 Tax=Reticulomyxa filosa TaxID=46433 RepID=X6P930_RETFI|nr:hypothetical protein RFI_02469 [Reticulomyxa filosa]|eukprot:ETO34618.1 hypothetical protein RFI_02469 [Reticulomyxa filosa]
MALDVESVWLSQKHLIENLERTNQFYSARLVKTINRFQYTAMQLKIPRKGQPLPNASASSLSTESNADKKETTEENANDNEEEDEIENEKEKGKEQEQNKSGQPKKNNRKHRKHGKGGNPAPSPKKNETGLAIPGNKKDNEKNTKEKEEKEKKGDGKRVVNEVNDINIGSDDVSFSAIPMDRDVEMQVSRSDYEFDVYYALQHRECLNNTKYCEFWELFLWEPSEDKSKSKSSILNDFKNGDSDEDEYHENYFVLAFPDKNKPKEKIQYPDTSQAVQKLYQQGAYLGMFFFV